MRVRDQNNGDWELQLPAVGRGGQADVYRAQRVGSVEVLAAKVFREIQTFERELSQLTALLRDDPHADRWLMVPRGWGRSNGQGFILFPWAEETLADALVSDDLLVRAHLLAGAAEAVHRFHRSNRDGTVERVHRDIKPANFLIGADGRVRLNDLGLARDTHWTAPATNTTSRTIRYAPPEQGLPLPGAPREHWDVYALAVTIFQGLTRRFPMASLGIEDTLSADGRDLCRLEEKRLASTLTPTEIQRWEGLRLRAPEQLLDLDEVQVWTPEDRATLSGALLDVAPELEKPCTRLEQELERALQRDPRRRAESVRGLQVALAALIVALGGERSAETTPASSPPAPAEVKRASFPLLSLGCGGALLSATGAGALLVGMVWAGASGWSPGDTPPIVPVEAAASTGEPSASPAAPPAASPAGSSVAPATVVAADPGAASASAARKRTASPDPSPPTDPAARADTVPVLTPAAPPDTPPVVAPADPPPAPTSRAVLLRTCPTDVTLTVDGQVVPAPGLMGARVSLHDGVHTIAWSYAGQPGSERFTSGEGQVRWCRDFLQSDDAGCGC